MLNERIIESIAVGEEFDWRNAARTAAISTAIGAGILGAARMAELAQKYNPLKTATQSAPISKHMQDIIYSDSEKTRDAFLASFLKGKMDEYTVIKSAAIRNGIKPFTEDFYILLAIRLAENGPKGLEFGVMADKAKNTNLNTQAGWAAATIVKCRQRWLKSGAKGDFIDFLASRYCPIGAENDPTGLNKNWAKNVKYWVKRLQSAS